MSVRVNDNPQSRSANPLPETQTRAQTQVSAISSGSLIVNADDWGRTKSNTDRTLELIFARRVSSGSAMVFMEDSERAAALAREHAVDAGLHLNFTLPFTGAGFSERMKTHQKRVARFLLSHRLAPALYRPDLAASFEYLVRTQIEEYERLYGFAPHRLDGHHHMHLCANVIRQKLLPAGAIVRRNFTFRAGEKDLLNRAYRGWQDWRLAQRYRIADAFFDLIPMTAERLAQVLSLARCKNVEMETHLYMDDQYEFLRGPVFENLLGDGTVSRGYVLAPARKTAENFSSCSSSDQLQDVPECVPELTALAGGNPPHIAVCICTYKRPLPLLRLLEALERQETRGLFTYSISIVDNDRAASAAMVVEKFAAASSLQIHYTHEPARGIARARNRVVSSAEGEFQAWIDDDEFPEPDWLLQALLDCRRFNADGVLGPVYCVFENEPPAWLAKSQLFQRRIYPGGEPVQWLVSRTSNVLVKRSVFQGDAEPFRVEIRAGEDQEFFYRKQKEGFRFVWSEHAIVRETIPPARCRLRFIVRRALLQGACESSLPEFRARSVVKSLLAVPLYAVALPFSLLLGGHRFAALLEKFSYHLGKLLMAVGIDPIREEYVSD